MGLGVFRGLGFRVYRDPSLECNRLRAPLLSREWGNGFWTIIGDYIGTTIGIHSPIPY